MFLAAAIQLRATSDVANNMAMADQLIRSAAARGAELISTPEATNYLGPHDLKVTMAERLDGRTVTTFRELARELGVHLNVGSINELGDDKRCYNTSLLIAPDGELIGVYRKIHLFDVDVPGGVRFAESDTTLAGSEPVVVQTKLGAIGMSVCYDLRFPGLYTELVNRGAQILLVPSAFTERTGRDHWHPLLRARAIETQTYVIAAGQWGEHDDGGLRRSYGHSLIIDPWGHEIGMVGDGVGMALGQIELERVAQVRQSMPVATHRKW